MVAKRPAAAGGPSPCARHTLAAVRSERRRNEAERQWLHAHGHRAAVFELQRKLHFLTIEPVVRETLRGADVAALENGSTDPTRRRGARQARRMR
jgi:hypothetical protein